MTDNHNHQFGVGDGIPVELPVIVHDEPARN